MHVNHSEQHGAYRHHRRNTPITIFTPPTFPKNLEVSALCFLDSNTKSKILNPWSPLPAGESHMVGKLNSEREIMTKLGRQREQAEHGGPQNPGVGERLCRGGGERKGCHADRGIDQRPGWAPPGPSALTLQPLVQPGGCRGWKGF